MIKDVIGFEEYYSITDDGKIFSKRSNRYLKLNPKDNGYIYIELNVGGQPYYKRVHRLVAEAFIPNPENKPYVNHIDGNKSNNNVSNLEWVTDSENAKHCIKLGLIKARRYKYKLYDLDNNLIYECIGSIEMGEFLEKDKSSVLNYINAGKVHTGKYKGYKLIREKI